MLKSVQADASQTFHSFENVNYKCKLTLLYEYRVLSRDTCILRA